MSLATPYRIPHSEVREGRETRDAVSVPQNGTEEKPS